MRREYVAVLDGDGRVPDEVVGSCVATSRAAAERRLDPHGLYIVMTRRKAESRGLIDLRDTARFCK